MRRFLLQMAGPSGSGKSTLARAIGAATGAVVIDKDVIKATMLDGDALSGAEPLPESSAAMQSYAVFFALGESLLGMGWSVVLDSPASFSFIRQQGRRLAHCAGVTYQIIDCSTPDLAELQRRLDNRPHVSSQLTVAWLGPDLRPGASPLSEPHLTLDTRQPVAAALRQALEYLERDAS